MIDVSKKKVIEKLPAFLAAIFKIKPSLLSKTRAISRNLNHYLKCRGQNKKSQTIFEILL